MPSEDEVPPEEMWGHDEGLIQWFKDVKAKRENSSGSSTMETIPDMNENELTNQLGL